MSVSLAKPTDAPEPLIAAYVRRGLSDYFARQQYRGARQWAEKLSPEERARLLTLPAIKRSPMTVHVLNEVTAEQHNAH
ncbi:hypothetical protein M2155_001995 [Streptomyces sp. SAI-119]|uniref:hypothetical protein n=1 Tax=Streptomyces sp. SAI-119 TaxID=2940541 RepID=UPI00247372F0|nr:hypothetical protein [Streptomyces sp. SAI-119]MDH6449587.1 hypothetical protein [Streptomyces sp. SAI-119]